MDIDKSEGTMVAIETLVRSITQVYFKEQPIAMFHLNSFHAKLFFQFLGGN
jgi:hypothetical protein